MYGRLSHCCVHQPVDVGTADIYSDENVAKCFSQCSSDCLTPKLHDGRESFSSDAAPDRIDTHLLSSVWSRCPHLVRTRLHGDLPAVTWRAEEDVWLMMDLHVFLSVHWHSITCLCECVNMHTSLTFPVSFNTPTSLACSSPSLDATFPPFFLPFLPDCRRALCVRIQLSNLHAKRCIRCLCDCGPRRSRDGARRWAGEQSK